MKLIVSIQCLTPAIFSNFLFFHPNHLTIIGMHIHMCKYCAWVFFFAVASTDLYTNSCSTFFSFNVFFFGYFWIGFLKCGWICKLIFICRDYGSFCFLLLTLLNAFFFSLTVFDFWLDFFALDSGLLPDIKMIGHFID